MSTALILQLLRREHRSKAKSSWIWGHRRKPMPVYYTTKRMLSLLLWYNRGDKNGGAAMCRFKFRLRLWAAPNSDLLKVRCVIEVSKTVGRQCAASSSAFGIVGVQLRLVERRVTESHCKFRLWKCLRLAERGKTAGIKTCMALIVQIYMSILPFMREQ